MDKTKNRWRCGFGVYLFIGTVALYGKLSFAEMTLVSIDSAGQQSTQDSYLPAIGDFSGGNRCVSFESSGFGGHAETFVYVHNLDSGLTVQASGSAGSASQLSGDCGTWAFRLEEAGRIQAYWRDRAGSPAGFASSGGVGVGRLELSGDGRYLAFDSDSSNLVAGDSTGVRDVFVYDTLTARVVRASVTPRGEQSDGHSSQPSLSADGNYLVFRSVATNLLGANSDGKQLDVNGVADVFRTDVHQLFEAVYNDSFYPRAMRISVTDNDAGGNAQSSYPDISADGTRVVFVSESTNLVTGDSNSQQDVFVRDLRNKSTELVSVSDQGQAASYPGYYPAISGDGRYVVFETSAALTQEAVDGGHTHIYRRDIDTNRTTMVSAHGNGTPGDGRSGRADINFDGGIIVFESDASNLVEGDVNGKRDIFIKTEYSNQVRQIAAVGLSEIGNVCVIDGVAVNTSLPQLECDALSALSRSFPDPSAWKVSADPCDWEGVTCVGGAVYKLLIRKKALSGEIPGELGSLSGLAVLDLSGNELSGAIPSTLGSLTSIRRLYLHKNQLSGAIPSELGNLMELQRLHLEINQLTGGIPVQLGNLAELEVLALSDNQLSGPVPGALGDLSKLVDLLLYYNRFSGEIPEALGSLGKLEFLGLSGNLLTGTLPASFGNLSSLAGLDVTDNQLSGALPSELLALADTVFHLRMQHNGCLTTTDSELRAWLFSISPGWGGDCAPETQWCNGLPATITSEARSADGVIRGTSGDDVIVGSELVDYIYGYGGKDTICGRGGNDRIYGGKQDDLLFGGTGNDRMFGNRGSDILHGGSGDDRLYGFAGNDRLFGEAGDNRIFGGDGNDDYCDGGADGGNYIHARSCERVNPEYESIE